MLRGNQEMGRISEAPESVVNPPSVEAVALGSTALTRREFSGDRVVIINPNPNLSQLNPGLDRQPLRLLRQLQSSSFNRID